MGGFSFEHLESPVPVPPGCSVSVEKPAVVVLGGCLGLQLFFSCCFCDSVPVFNFGSELPRGALWVHSFGSGSLLRQDTWQRPQVGNVSGIVLKVSFPSSPLPPAETPVMQTQSA